MYAEDIVFIELSASRYVKAMSFIVFLQPCMQKPFVLSRFLHSGMQNNLFCCAFCSQVCKHNLCYCGSADRYAKNNRFYCVFCRQVRIQKQSVWLCFLQPGMLKPSVVLRESAAQYAKTPFLILISTAWYANTLGFMVFFTPSIYEK